MGVYVGGGGWWCFLSGFCWILLGVRVHTTVIGFRQKDFMNVRGNQDLKTDFYSSCDVTWFIFS